MHDDQKPFCRDSHKFLFRGQVVTLSVRLFSNASVLKLRLRLRFLAGPMTLFMD